MALRVDMSGNSTGFKKMLDEARMDAKAFGSGLGEDVSYSFTRAVKGALTGVIGYEVFDKLKESFSWFTETGTEIKDISDQLGMSTDQWQKWADAVEQAGLQTEGFVRVIEALKEKRTEALTDPKARAQLTQLGFTDAEISGPMSTSDFVKKALQNANTNPWAQKAFDSIAGTQGAKYTRALGYLPNAQAEFSDSALDQAARAQQLAHGVQKNLVEPLKEAIPMMFMDRDFQKGAAFLAWRGIQAGLGRGWLWNRSGSVMDGVANVRDGLPANYRPARAMRDGKPATAADISNAHGGPFVGPHDPRNDPLYAVLQQQNRDLAVRDQERTQRVTDSDRQLMTIGDRFKSIRQEMGPLVNQIQQHKDALGTPEGFLTDAQKQSLSGVTGYARTIQVNEMREKYQDELSEMQMRLNKDKADLRQAPLNFQADNLAKVGLYSANALAFNPVLGLHQKTNQILEKIAQNTSKPTVQPPSDPHRR
jgi:hypothetical protein